MVVTRSLEGYGKYRISHEGKGVDAGTSKNNGCSMFVGHRKTDLNYVERLQKLLALGVTQHMVNGRLVDIRI